MQGAATQAMPFHRRGAATQQMPAAAAPLCCGSQARWLRCSLLTDQRVCSSLGLAIGPGSLQQSVTVIYFQALTLFYDQRAENVHQACIH